MRYVDLQALLAAAEGAKVRHRPIQVDQPQQALDEPGRLPECHADQHLRRQAGLDRGIAIVRLPATFCGGPRLPDHGGIKPDRQRAAALERLVVVRQVPGLVGGGCRSAHAVQLPRWIHKMNPAWDLCNRAIKPYHMGTTTCVVILLDPRLDGSTRRLLQVLKNPIVNSHQVGLQFDMLEVRRLRTADVRASTCENSHASLHSLLPYLLPNIHAEA